MSIKCVNCNNVVEPKMSIDQICIALLLFCLGFIPGFLYLVACSKQKCPSCGSNVYFKDHIQEYPEQECVEIE